MEGLENIDENDAVAEDDPFAGEAEEVEGGEENPLEGIEDAVADLEKEASPTDEIEQKLADIEREAQEGDRDENLQELEDLDNKLGDIEEETVDGAIEALDKEIDQAMANLESEA